jgi:hypothetical protein
VLSRLNDAAGLGLSPAFLSELSSGPDSFAKRLVFEDANFKFEERVKHLDVVDRARALKFYLKVGVSSPFCARLVLTSSQNRASRVALTTWKACYQRLRRWRKRWRAALLIPGFAS